MALSLLPGGAAGGSVGCFLIGLSMGSRHGVSRSFPFGWEGDVVVACESTNFLERCEVGVRLPRLLRRDPTQRRGSGCAPRRARFRDSLTAMQTV